MSLTNPNTPVSQQDLQDFYHKIVPYMGGGGASSLSGLSDVTVATPTDGQVLTYDNTTSKWVNANASGGASDLDDLSDVTITSATSGQVLKYNGSAWVNSAESGGASDLNDLSDVVITSASNGQTLKYDSTTSKWINAPGSYETFVTGTLLAGETTITLSNAAITTSSIIDPYTDTFGVNPTNVVVSTGQVVLTFLERGTDLGVAVGVK